MKTFTLTLAFLTCAIFGFSQKDAGWQNKILKQRAKNELVLKRIAKLTNSQGISADFTSDPLAQLKSAAKQKLDSIVSWEYDQLSKDWKYDEKTTWEYDNQMRALRTLNIEWMEDSKTWKTEDKSEFVYGSNGKISSTTTYDLNDISGLLEADSKMEHYYKPDGRLDSLCIYSNEPQGTWTLDAKFYYYYDASGRVKRWETWMTQDDEDEPNFGAWIKGGIFKFDYDGSGKIIKQETFIVLDVDEMLSSQTAYKYNASSQLESTESYSLNYLTFMLEKDNRTIYQYNAAGDVSIEIYSTWDKTEQEWNEKDKYENTYGTLSSADVVYPANELLLIAILDPSQRVPNKAIASDKTFEMTDDGWVQTDKSAYYYSIGGATKIDELEKPSLSFYPNPASENITLKWTARYSQLNLQVFQINGAKVMEQKVFSDEKISVSHLVKGMYLLKLLDGRENVYTGKLVKN